MPINSDLSSPSDDSAASAAADVIRQKLKRLYADEPDALAEIAEAGEAARPSRHQLFMQQLSQSGKDLATIQTEWHQYYQSLSDEDKHQVWQEFYSSHVQPAVLAPALPRLQPTPQQLAEHKHEATVPRRSQAKRRTAKKLLDARSSQKIRAAIRDKVTAGGKLKAKHHLQSLAFGLGMGFFVLLIFMFTFFNQFILIPLYQPGRNNTNTPIIASTADAIPADKNEIIIPKINVQIPLDFTQTTTDETAIEAALDNGIVHYPTTVKPGETGNAAFFGHSSNNIFNKGKYKFAFVMLRTLQPGDTFYITYNKKVYVYKVFDKKVVPPTQVSVLDPVPNQRAVATLITCDPPGTSINRMVVFGQQISPDPAGNVAAASPLHAPEAKNVSAQLPGNGKTLLGRVLGSWPGKTLAIIIVTAALLITLRWVRGLRG